jgi:hypothetical protein
MYVYGVYVCVYGVYVYVCVGDFAHARQDRLQGKYKGVCMAYKGVWWSVTYTHTHMASMGLWVWVSCCMRMRYVYVLNLMPYVVCRMTCIAFRRTTHYL